MNLKFKFRLSAFQIILIGFALAILFGGFILSLPISSKSGEWTPFIDSLFTSTSAMCVTGLVAFDTATHWSLFGQIVILFMIQIGGMGIMMVATSFALISGKKIGLFERSAMKESISAPNVGGIVRFTKFIIIGIFSIEFIGAAIMFPVFFSEYGVEGIWMSIFHSISAFCNAGFDLMGTKTGEFSSITGFSAQPLINIVLILLITIGGIGFLVWDDVCHHKFRINRYRTQSKIVLIVSGLLIILPAIYFFFGELYDLPIKERIFTSLFQSVTLRTAGFNTVDFNNISDVGLTLMMFLMLIGGSPGSTAGGMKTTTIAVLFTTAIAVFRKKDDTEIMKRRIDDNTVKSALALFLLYLTLFFVSGMTISLIEDIPLITCLFEAASAVGTVGLTLGITPGLGIASRIILIVLMFFGRVGAFTFIYGAFGENRKQLAKYPVDKIAIG